MSLGVCDPSPSTSTSTASSSEVAPHGSDELALILQRQVQVVLLVLGELIENLPH